MLHVLRWESRIRSDGDTFAINDHDSSLLSRLYIEEVPAGKVNFTFRTSNWDAPLPNEWRHILNAFQPLRRLPAGAKAVL